MATSFKDPVYDELDAKFAAQVGVPAWLMSSIRLNGERSNSDQVSSAGAKTVNQFTPTTRKLVMDKYDVDPWASDEASTLGKAYLLKESLDRNGQDPAAAAREYIGGTNTANHGPQTRAYVNRVMMGRPKAEQAAQPGAAPSGGRSLSGELAASRPQQPSIAKIYEAYQAGKMSPEQEKEFEADVNSGSILLPRKASLKVAPESNVVPDAVIEAYVGGKMNPQQVAEYEADLKSGAIKLPEGMTHTPAEAPGLIDRVKDVFTGNLRATAETANLPEWTGMPELNQLSMASAKTGLGTMFAPTDEAVKIIQAQFPGVKVRQDEKGNPILTSSVDGKEYAVPPGLSVGDIPRVLGGVAAFVPSGGAATIPGMIAGGAATQAAIEGTQAATGGQFNAGEVALAGAAGPVANLVAKGVGGAVRGVAGVLQKGGAPVEQQVARAATTAPEAAAVRPAAEVPPGAPAPAATPVAVAEAPIEQAANSVWKSADSDIPVIFKGVEPTAGPDGRMYARVEVNGKLTYVPADELVMQGAAKESAAVAPKVMATEAAPAAEMSQEQLASLAKKAATSSMGKKSATEELAAQATPNKAVTEAADRLKMELDPDFVTDNEQFRRLVGLARSQAGSAAESRGIKVAEDAANKAEEALESLGASRDIASVSDKVKSSLAATRDDMEKASNALYKEIDEVVPKSYPVEMPATKARIEAVVSDLGGMDGLSGQEKQLAKMFEGPVTYGRLARERGLIGKALAGKESPYGSMEEGALKQLYKAMAEDQLEAVTAIGGEALRDKYRLASQLVAKRKGLEKRIVGAFGKDGSGSLVPALRNSIGASVRGDDKGLAKLVQTIPEPLRKEALSSALLSYATSTTKGGQFGFPQYSKMYQGMRQNSPVYATIVKTLGEGSDELLTDLYQVSQSIAKAQQAVLHTGKANQGFLDTLKGPETLVGKVLEGAKGAAARGAATEAATSIAIGPTGAGFLGGAVQSLAGGRKDALKAVGDLLTSPEFKEVVRQSATKGFVSDKSIQRLARARAMKGYSSFMSETFKKDPTEREAWINAALQSGRGKDREQPIAGQGKKL